MVKTEDFQLCQQPLAFYALGLNHASRLCQDRQQNELPSAAIASTFSTNYGVPIVQASGLQDLRTGQSNGAIQNLTFLNSSLASHNIHLGESKSTLANGLRAKGTTDDVAGCNQKKFLIFDRSGCQTRLFVSAFCSPLQHPNASFVRNDHTCHLQEENQEAIYKKISPFGPIIQEKLHVNYKFCEENETLEDTEEMNALLYSDDNDEDCDSAANDDTDCENEVMSSDWAPLTFKGMYEKDEEADGIEEVASSNCLAKKQRFLDGGYSKVSSRNIPGQDDDAGSSCGSSKNLDMDMSYLIAKTLSRKGQIHETLRILKSVIPGLKSNDPLSVIDEAISYLKYLRDEARAPGFNYP